MQVNSGAALQIPGTRCKRIGRSLFRFHYLVVSGDPSRLERTLRGAFPLDFINLCHCGTHLRSFYCGTLLPCSMIYLAPLFQVTVQWVCRSCVNANVGKAHGDIVLLIDVLALGFNPNESCFYSLLQP